MEMIINGITYVQKTAELTEDYCIIRCDRSGVHAGYLVSREGQEVTLKDARRIWYWDGAASLSQMALEGVKKPENCKFSVVLPKIILLDAIEVLPATEAAKKSIEGVPVWKV